MKQIEPTILQRVIQKRPLNSFKGTFGNVLIVGGSSEMGGAAIMAGSAAVHAGAGLVTIASETENLAAIHSVIPEAMFVDYLNHGKLKSLVEKANVIVIGPGLALDDRSLSIMKTVFDDTSSAQTLIIDGSAITLLSQNQLAVPTDPQIIYTPHQMEWQRLSGILIANQNNPSINQKIQEKLNATVILKKHHTEIYFENHQIYQLPIGTPSMATGGMGDTLTGILAAFIAQFKAPFEDKIQAAVYTHSQIADELAHDNYVVLPTNIIDYLQPFMRKQVHHRLL